MRIVEWRVQVVALLTVVSVAASPAAAVLGPGKASTLVTVAGYDAMSSNCGGEAVEVDMFLTDRGEFATLPARTALVVTGFSWVISGATANSMAEVTLWAAAAGGGSGINLVTSIAVANSDGLAVGSITLQPGVVFRPAAGLTHLCISQSSASGTLRRDGALQGYLAPDK